MGNILKAFLLILVLGVTNFCAAYSAFAKDVEIFAASSIIEPLEAIVSKFKDGYPRLSVRITAAASSRLARLIKHGAPADIFISANAQWVDYLRNRNLLIEQTLLNLIGNRLVLAVSAQIPVAVNGFFDKGLNNLLSKYRFVLANPDHVPLGIYSRQALNHLGIWEAVRLRAIFSRSSHHGLRLLLHGGVEMGFVYESDKQNLGNGYKFLRIPSYVHDPIIYRAALVGRKKNEKRRIFFRYLSHPTVSKIFEMHGFEDLKGLEKNP